MRNGLPCIYLSLSCVFFLFITLSRQKLAGRLTMGLFPSVLYISHTAKSFSPFPSGSCAPTGKSHVSILLGLRRLVGELVGWMGEHWADVRCRCDISMPAEAIYITRHIIAATNNCILRMRIFRWCIHAYVHIM